MKNILFYDVIHIHVTVTTKNTTPPPEKYSEFLNILADLHIQSTNKSPHQQMKI